MSAKFCDKLDNGDPREYYLGPNGSFAPECWYYKRTLTMEFGSPTACEPMIEVYELRKRVDELMIIESSAKLHAEDARKHGASYNVAEKILNGVVPDKKVHNE